MATAPVGNLPSANISPVWGPFRGPADAKDKVGRFVDRAVGPSAGIAWVGGGGLCPLRRPTYNANGFGEIVVVEWRNFPAPPAPAKHLAASGFWGKIRALFDAYMEQQGQQALMQGRIAMEQGRMLNNAVSTLYQRAFRDHGADTAGVALDALAVGLTIGFVSGPIGWIAMGGALFLLAADGVAWGAEMAGEDEWAEEKKKQTEPWRWIAIAASIPDAGWGLFKVFRELPETGRTLADISRLRAGSQSTAARASADAARAGREAAAAGDAATAARKAAFARRYEAIADRARQRAAEQAAKLARTWAELGGTALHEVTPRATVPASIKLMMADDINPENQTATAQFMRHYVFHVTSVHR